MILKVREIGLSLEMENRLLDKLLETGKKHYPNEFGGFLIGHYINDNKHLKITDSILPTKYRTSKLNFERSVEGIDEQLCKLYYEEPSRFYVGEWHTHPDNRAIPSSTDIKAISSIANMEDSCIKNPVLLIIGYSKTQSDCEFYVFDNNKIYRYE